MEYIKENKIWINTNYLDSWNYIKKDNNSLKRFTNLGIVFKDINPKE
ncbi:MAG: hypothetical protein RR702_06890 [Clostridia bacterium]